MKVRNRCNSVVGYTIPDLNIQRRFAPGESKTVAKEELEKLVYQPGGLYILANCLQVSKEDAKALDLRPEREYFLSDQQIKDLILTKSLDEFLDALDFAPIGVIDLIKKFAISLPMTDLAKAEALKEKAGFDVIKALEFERQAKKDLEEAMDTKPASTGLKRRINGENPDAPVESTSRPKRRVVPQTTTEE